MAEAAGGHPIQCVLLMGVSGAGKTTIGQLLAAHLGWHFVDGDDVHPEANRRKMANGQPLDDSDREPWLQRLRRLIDEQVIDEQVINERLTPSDHGTVIACSALKQAYRELLGVDRPGILLTHLLGPPQVLAERLRQRRGHFMPPDLLASQLATLEPPANALCLDIRQPPSVLCEAIVDIVSRGSRRP